MKKQNGFTLIELVIVIIVLGILAATAVPKFLNLQDDAKVSAMKGLESALHSAANIVYSKAAIDGFETVSDSAVSDAGTTIQIVYGYPKASADGIGKAVELSGFSPLYTNGVAKFWNGNASSANDTCVTYTQATSSARYTIVSAECS
jgi:MSHA pilin protein MshA